MACAIRATRYGDESIEMSDVMCLACTNTFSTIRLYYDLGFAHNEDLTGNVTTRMARIL